MTSGFADLDHFWSLERFSADHKMSDLFVAKMLVDLGGERNEAKLGRYSWCYLRRCQECAMREPLVEHEHVTESDFRPQKLARLERLAGLEKTIRPSCFSPSEGQQPAKFSVRVFETGRASRC